jgi:hypothetical protein
MKKMIEQTVDVDKMGTELPPFNKLKDGLEEIAEDNPVLEWKWEVYNKREYVSFITDWYYTEEEIHRFPNISVIRKIPETERSRV